MVSNGNHPLNQRHYDEDTLHEYVLGQLLPDEEEQIRQHVDVCPLCRAAVTDLQSFTRRLSFDLHQELDQAQPGPESGLSFDRIASEFRKPPRRVTFSFRLRQFAPGASLALLLVLFVAALLALFPSENAAALRSLELTDDYSGPPAIVAASTENGLVIVRLSADGSDVIYHLPAVNNPRYLSFSADGRWLAFQQGRTLTVMEAQENGGSIRFTVRDTAEWSWSGPMLAYTDGNGQLAVFDTSTQTSRILVPASEFAWGVPIWTAGGQQIAYAVVNPLPAEGGPVLQQGLWRVTVETGYRVEIVRNGLPGETILVPAAWNTDASTLLAWDVSAGANGQPPTLYRVNVAAHDLEPIEGYSLAQGTRLAWPVGPQDTLLLARQDNLITLPLGAEDTGSALATVIPWPQALEWATNGAWFAYTVAGAAEGQGVYLFALHENELRPVELPGGAGEKAVFWAGAEHLFVIRQPQNTFISELWLVPLTTGEPPQRVLTNLRQPLTGPYNGWRWHDILAAQVIAPF